MDALFGPDGTQVPDAEPLFLDALSSPGTFDLAAAPRVARPAPPPPIDRAAAGDPVSRPPAPTAAPPVPPAPRNRRPASQPRATVTGGRGDRPVRPGEPVPGQFPLQATPQLAPETPRRPAQVRPAQVRPAPVVAAEPVQRRRRSSRNGIGCLIVAMVVFGWILVVIIRAAVHSLQP